MLISSNLAFKFNIGFRAHEIYGSSVIMAWIYTPFNCCNSLFIFLCRLEYVYEKKKVFQVKLELHSTEQISAYYILSSYFLLQIFCAKLYMLPIPIHYSLPFNSPLTQKATSLSKGGREGKNTQFPLFLFLFFPFSLFPFFFS